MRPWAAAAVAVVAAALALPLPAAAQDAGSADSRPRVRADSAILVETTTGDVLYARRPDRPRAIASATKLMTALLTLERVPRLAEQLPASRYRPAPIEAQLGLRPGERLTVADLLRGLLLESASDAAITLAEGTAGSRPAFVRAMNARARELGLSRTRYANPIGLDAPGNRSTARDLVQLTLQLRTHEFFRRTVAREKVTLESGDRVRVIANRNTLVTHPRVDGVKTGHTRQAEYVLVASGRSPQGVRLISVVLGEPSEQARNEDTLALLRWGFGRYTVTRPVRRGQGFEAASVPIRYRRGAELPLVAARTVEHVVRRGDPAPEVQVVDVPEIVEGPLRRGQRIGRAAVLVSHSGRVVARIPLVAASAVPEAGLAERLKDGVTRPFTLIGLLLAGGASVLLARVVLRRRRRRGGPARRAPETA
jgi:D-alanyl-D-alanine carboxypeptidase (penicillin-binding protein 5/6)